MGSAKMISLSGEWRIAKDKENVGKGMGWAKAVPDTDVYDVNVPEYIPNTQWPMDISYSNIFPEYQGYVWYYKEFEACSELADAERLLAVFERVAYICEVYVNGEYAGRHTHQEKEFSLDVTDKVNYGKKNLMAVRCFEPRALGGDIDGIKLSELPNSCFAQVAAFAAGSDTNQFCLECIGGILGFVHLQVVPDTRIDDIYVRSFWENGDVCARIGIINAGDKPQNKKVEVVFADKKSGAEICTVGGSYEIPPGRSEVVLRGRIQNHHLWELDMPVLYTATAAVDGKGHTSVRFGFRDFRIKNGFFFLNGKRIFIKGAHTAINASSAISMKALGFNMIRTIARAFNEETLNICDEIGLLVMDAAATAWGMTLHENSRAQIEDYNIDMIKASRNHPSVVMYCLFNENSAEKKELFSYGVQSLPKLREYAPDAVFLLHSGRWDREISLGSASNPGSDKWDVFFGAEGIIDYPKREVPMYIGGFGDAGMGDVHIYMQVPVVPDTVKYLRTLGHGLNPVFVSESGIASQTDPMGEYLSHCNKRLSGAVTLNLVKRLWDETESFLEFYDLKNVYPLSFDFVRDTEKLNGAQRTLLYNIYRANPMVNGFSFTSFGVSNEGTLQGNNVIKDSLAYAIQQGNEPLRWSLFSSGRTVYAGKPFEIEAVLCNEDVLAPGDYSAQAYIKGKDGCVWKKEFVLNYPAEGYGGMAPLAFSALREQVILPEGEYVFSARLITGGVAYDGDLKITVLEPKGDIDAEIAVCGLSERVTTFLNEHGIRTKELCREHLSEIPKAVFVGGSASTDIIGTLHELAAFGSSIVFTDLLFFEKNADLLKSIAGESAFIRNVKGTIYHNDNIGITHPLFDGIKNAGVLEFDKFGMVYPDYLFASVAKPSKTICASIRIEISFSLQGLTIGEYAAGKGKYVLNAFDITNSLGKHPYADQMLLNFARHYSS